LRFFAFAVILALCLPLRLLQVENTSITELMWCPKTAGDVEHWVCLRALAAPLLFDVLLTEHFLLLGVLPSRRSFV
jgi:hypothetical protein